MSTRSAFLRGVHPLLSLLLHGKEAAGLAMEPDHALRDRIEELAARSTQGMLTSNERDEYEGYAKAMRWPTNLWLRCIAKLVECNQLRL